MAAFDCTSVPRGFFPRFFLVAFACVVGVPGCAPIDQRTFDPNAGKPPSPPIASVSAPAQKAPFLQILEGTPESEYAPPVEAAAKAALARKANVLFIVQGIAPMQNTPDKQAQALSDVMQNLVVPVSEHIKAAGARPVQLEMRADTDSTAQHAMVRVNVR